MLLLPALFFAQDKKQSRADIITLTEILSRELLNDTVKFNTADIIFTNIGRMNTRSYAKLYIVHHKKKSYVYKLDIVPSDKVRQFTKAILIPENIKQIDILAGNSAMSIYGGAAKNGTVIITLKEESDVNMKMLGLKMKNKKMGDNFSARKSGEYLIHN